MFNRSPGCSPGQGKAKLPNVSIVPWLSSAASFHGSPASFHVPWLSSIVPWLSSSIRMIMMMMMIMPMILLLLLPLLLPRMALEEMGNGVVVQGIYNEIAAFTAFTTSPPVHQSTSRHKTEQTKTEQMPECHKTPLDFTHHFTHPGTGQPWAWTATCISHVILC